MKRKALVWFDDRNITGLLQNSELSDRFPSVSIACSPKCNLKCPHCIYDAGTGNKTPLSPVEKVELLERSHYLGVQFLQICHEGEPFLDSAVPLLIKKASTLGMKIFMYTNGTLITKEIAELLYTNEVCLGVKLDSLNPKVFNRMLGVDQANEVYQGIQNLIDAGYNKPFEKDGKLYTRLSLVCTLTSVNTENIEEIKDVARFCWDNNLFFGAARLEQGGRATGQVWDDFKVPDKQKIIDLIDWCSEQTGINYWHAQPTPYCIGVCGLQIADNGDVWLTQYGGSCDFTEPDGESYPESLKTIANVREKSLEEILDLAWDFRRQVYKSGVLDQKLEEYEATKDIYPNGLQDCGSARTYTLFKPFHDYIKTIVERDIADRQDNRMPVNISG